MFVPARDLETNGRPECGTGDEMILMAQAVPSASFLPCIAALPAGWSPGLMRAQTGRATFTLRAARGRQSVRITLREADRCSVREAAEVPSDEAGMHRYERPDQLPPRLRTTRTYQFDGGCVVYDFALNGRDVAPLLFDIDAALAFEPRGALVDKVHRDAGLGLCGAGVACVGGS
jgi:hypothetical protein